MAHRSHQVIDGYDPLFVPRRTITKQFFEWLEKPNPRFRLRSLIGSPGIGKTVLLNLIRSELADRNSLKLIPLNLDVRKISSLSGDTPTKFNTWFYDQIGGIPELANCRDINRNLWPTSRDNAFEYNLECFAEVVCRCCENALITLFVDSYDEVSGDEQIMIEDMLIYPFLSNCGEMECTRVIVARRDVDRLKNLQLNWEEKQIILDEFIPSQASDQINRRLKQLKTGIKSRSELAHKMVEKALDSQLNDEELGKVLDLEKDQLSKIGEFLEPLLTRNPFVNVRLLYWRLLRDLDSKDLLTKCLDDLLDRSDFPLQEDGNGVPTINQAREVLEILVTHLDDPDSWAVADYQGLLDDDLIDIPFEDLEPYFQKGIIMQITGQPLYRIEGALCELIHKLNGTAA